MDQTTSAHQGLLRNLRERGKGSSLGGALGLRAGRHLEKAPRSRSQLVQNSPNSQGDDFRKKPNFIGAYNFTGQVLDCDPCIQLNLFEL